MKTPLKLTCIASAIIALAVIIGTQLADTSLPPSTRATPPPTRIIQPAPPLLTQAQPTLSDLRMAWSTASTIAQLDPIAQTLAERDSPEAIQVLLESIATVKEWSLRAALAKNLRAVSNPDVLQALLPALLNNYGRGNTILNEISDTIARLAQPETVEDLAALHWQASVQAGQGHKVLRTVACIRNPSAARGLMKVATSDESPALVAAAHEALLAMETNE